MAYNLTDYWRIVTDTGTIPADAHSSAQNTVPIGETDERTLEFRRGAPHPETFVERANMLMEGYRNHAGRFNLNVTFDNGPRYNEAHRGESLLVALRPPETMGPGRGRGLWGLVADVNDEVNVPQTQWSVEVSMAYLAPLSAFDTHAEVREAYRRRGFH